MIDGVQFSGLGDAPTEFEVRLLQQARGEAEMVALGQRLMAEMGAAAGARALAVVLDELGAQKPYVPLRADFFAALWRAERDALVLDLAARGGWSQRDIADQLGVPRRTVRRIIRDGPRNGQHGPGLDAIPPA